MNRITQLRTTAAAILITCCSALASAEDPAADPAPPAADAPAASSTSAPAESPAGKKSFRLSIDADGGKDGDGIEISLDGDKDHAEIVARLIGRLETALESLPEDVRSSEQGDITELKAALEDLRQLKGPIEVHRELRVEDDSFLEQLAPVVALLVIFGGPVFIVAIVSRNNRRKREMVHQTIDRIIAQGKDVPVELLDALDKGSNGKSGLARGTVNVAIGLGVGGVFLANAGLGAASIGLIPLAIGLAQLLVWKLEKTRQQDV